MADIPLPDQPLPDWMSYSLVTDADGSEEYTIVSLPLTYYGPSIPLGTDGIYTYGGLTSPAETPTDDGGGAPAPAPTEAPTPGDQPPAATAAPEPSTVFVTVYPDPATVTVTETATVYITATNPTATTTALPAPIPIPGLSSEGVSASIGSAVPVPVPSSSLSGLVPVPTSGLSSQSTSSIPSTSSRSTTPTTTRPTISNLPPSNISSAGQPVPSATLPTDTTSNQAPIPESAVPSITGTAKTYLGLAPNAFLGLILAIVLSLIVLLCCLICFIRHRRRQRRKELEAYPPPTAEQGSRLLAGDRDPTREDLAYPYADQGGREYRRSQIAIMRARGELDDDWEDRVHSPSIRTASLRLPEDEIGTAYGIRERAYAAAGVRPPYGYTPVPRDAPSIGSGMRSIKSTGNSTVVPTVTPTTAGMSAMTAAGAAGAAVAGAKLADSDARASPTPRKDTQSTQATDSSALHMYAAGGRSRMDSSEGADQFFYQQTEEGEPPSAVASSSDLHFLQRYSTQPTSTAGFGFGTAAAAAGGAAAAAALASRRQRSRGSGSIDSSSGSAGASTGNRTRNLDDVPRAAIAYPESPVSDSQENSRLIAEGETGGGEPPAIVLGDAPPSRSHSRSTRESGLSRWIGDRSGSTSRASQQQQPILQRMLNRVMGNRASTQQPSFAVIPPSPARPPHPPSSYDQQYRDKRSSQNSNGSFEVGNGLRFPRPPVHTGYSSGASTARDDMRILGGILPSRWSFGASSRTPRGSTNVEASPSGDNNAAISQMEEGATSGGSGAGGSRLLGVPITTSRDTLPQMRERAPTPGGMPLLGFGLRPPPPSAFPPERRTSGVSSGRSTVYYDARSNQSTPYQTISSGQDRAASPYSRYDSPPPQPITALRNAQSAQSLESANTAPFFPPGLYSPDHTDDEDDLDLDDPPPMPTRDVRQARSLTTILSGGTTDHTPTAANSPTSAVGRAFTHDRYEQHGRLPSQGLGAGLGLGLGLGLDPSPRIARSVPSDVAPSEAAEADLGAGFGSFGQSSSGASGRHYGQRANIGEHGEIDVLEEEPPMATGSWRALSAYPQSETGSGRGSVRTGASLRDLAQRADWRLTLGQPVLLRDHHQDETLRYSQFGDITSQHEGSSMADSQGSRGSSNRTNVSHSRDIHSLRASEVGGTASSGGSRGTGQTGRSVSEHGHLTTPATIHGIEGEALLSAFGPGPSRGGTFGESGASRGPELRRGEIEGAPTTTTQPLVSSGRPSTPPSAPADFSTTPGIRLVGSSSSNIAGTSAQGPMSAPVLPTRGWPQQAVPMDVTAEEGRRPSHSFLFQEPASPPYTHSHSASGETHDISGAGTSDSHSHTHGTHGAETTMGTMTEATTEDHHTMQEMPLSDVEHILRPDVKADEGGEEGKRQVLETRIATPPIPGQWLDMPRWQ